MSKKFINGLPYLPGMDDNGPLILGSHRVADGLIAGTPSGSWDAVCEAYSRISGGQWFPRPRGLTWTYNKATLSVVEPQIVSNLVDARTIAVDCGVYPGWSYGSIARSLLEWIDIPKSKLPVGRSLECISKIGCRTCIPGTYTGATVWDCSSYYFEIMKRLPSYTCYCTRTGLIRWMKLLSDEHKRRLAFERIVSTNKLVRNACWGAMIGSSSWARRWTKGRMSPMPPLKGHFRSAGLVLSTSAWELTRDCSEDVKSIYTHTDCVTTLGGEMPERWDANGFKFKVDRSGDLDLKNMGSFMWAGVPSAHYHPKDLWIETIDVPAAPKMRLGAGWCYRKES